MIGADHHTHLGSPAAAARVQRFGDYAPRTSTELVGVLDADGVGAAVVLSMAYVFAMPDLGAADEVGMAAENDWVAESVAAHAGRLVACCSVNPLLPGAVREIERCAQSGSFVGLKLHLANSDVDLRDREHVDAVGDVFECADDFGLVIVVHMRTRRPDYGASMPDTSSSTCSRERVAFPYRSHTRVAGVATTSPQTQR